MSTVLSAMVGALIGATAVIVNSLLLNRHQLNLEKEKTRPASMTTLTTELRAAVAQVGLEMMSIQHSMEWVCWLAQMDQDMTDREIGSKYNQEVHERIPKMLGQMAVVASLDQRMYEQLNRLAQQLWDIDGHIARAFVRYKDSPIELSRELKSRYRRSVELYELLPKELAEIMRSGARPSTE